MYTEMGICTYLNMLYIYLLIYMYVCICVEANFRDDDHVSVRGRCLIVEHLDPEALARARQGSLRALRQGPK